MAEQWLIEDAAEVVELSVEDWVTAAFVAERAPRRVAVATKPLEPRRFVQAVRPFYAWMFALTLLALLLR